MSATREPKTIPWNLLGRIGRISDLQLNDGRRVDRFAIWTLNHFDQRILAKSAFAIIPFSFAPATFARAGPCRMNKV